MSSIALQHRIRKLCTRSAMSWALLISLPALAEDKHLFAAPPAGAAANNSGNASLSQVTLSLIIVLIVVFAAAWLLKRFRKINFSGSTQKLEVVAQVALGAKERAVLIRVNNVQVLVGVAPGQVNALHTFAATELLAATGDAPVKAPDTSVNNLSVPSFKALLKKSLGVS